MWEQTLFYIREEVDLKVMSQGGSPGSLVQPIKVYAKYKYRTMAIKFCIQEIGRLNTNAETI